MSGQLDALRCPHLDELRAFCAAADLGSIGRAAKRLHLTQPAISRRVKSLEQLVGAPLLERSPRGVSITPAGERLYAQAQRLLTDAAQLTATLNDMRGNAITVRLAISHTAAEFLMPRALREMRHRTSAAVEVLIANSSVVKEMVADGRADVAVAACIAGESFAGLMEMPVVKDEICVAVPLSHPWSRRREISPAQLLQTPIVLRDPGAHTREVIDETLAAHGLQKLTAACEVGSTEAAKQAAHELGLPTALSKLALSPADRLETVQVTGLRFPRRFSVLCVRSELPDDAWHLVEAFQSAQSAAADAADTGSAGTRPAAVAACA